MYKEKFKQCREKVTRAQLECVAAKCRFCDSESRVLENGPCSCVLEMVFALETNLLGRYQLIEQSIDIHV